MQIKRATAAITALLLITSQVVVATPTKTAEQKGRRIYEQRDAMEQGFTGQRVAMQMVLRDGGKQVAERELTVSEREGEGDQSDQTLIVFKRPRDIADTALLTHEQAGAVDDRQWLYLPDYKRSKRIASRNRSGRFVGTEFSYEDLAGDQLEDFTYKYLGEATLDGRRTHRIDRYPTNPNSQYSRQETWVDAENYQVLKARLFDKKGRHVKTLEARDWRRYKDRYWRPHRVTMNHLASGRSTEMIASEYELGEPISPARFRPQSLGSR